MDALVEQLSHKKLIAVDTEFFRETTYYPALALVQIATDSIVACIDPLAFNAQPALKKLLLDETITKIFHSCSQDLEVLFYYLGDIPNTIYDTQIANALLTDHHQIGYASLVENELSIQLEKSQTRTNWLQRPLTKKQIQYAGDDVLYLYQLHNRLDEKLTLSNRQTWLAEECNKLSNISFQVDIDKLWRRVKGTTRLSKKNLMTVQCIAIWREQLAQHKNKTRRKVLSDNTILRLVLDSPKNVTALNQSFAPNEKLNDNECQQLFSAIENAQKIPEEKWPDNQFNTLNVEQKVSLKNLQQLVNNKADELGISSAIICSKKELETLIKRHEKNHGVHDDDIPVELTIGQGWRLQCIGQTLVETLKET